MGATTMTNEFPRGDKSTWSEQADGICAGQIHIESAEVLLPWLQDGNWPGASKIACFLETRAESVLPAVESLLRDSHDQMWKYWVIVLLVQRWPAASVRRLRSVLLQLAEDSDADEVHRVALETLIQNRLINCTAARAMIDAKRKRFPHLEEDWNEIRDWLEG